MSQKAVRVLAVDDDEELLRLIRRVLEMEGFEVTTAETGDAAVRMVEQGEFDLALLDLMLPGVDGMAVCKHIRSFSTIPVILITARAHDEDKVKGLDEGADDYITKPFSTRELLARVRAVLRRSQMTFPAPSCPRLASGDLEIDFLSRRVTVAGEEVKLTPTEFNLLQELAQQNGKVLTHTHLLGRVWGPEYGSELRYLHVFVSRLRKKLRLERAGQQVIESISGVGYRFNIL